MSIVSVENGTKVIEVETGLLADFAGEALCPEAGDDVVEVDGGEVVDDVSALALVFRRRRCLRRWRWGY